MSDSLICASFADSPFFSRRLRLRFILPLYDMETDLPLDSTGLNLDFTLKIMERRVSLSATSTSIRDEWASAIQLTISNYKEEVSNIPFGQRVNYYQYTFFFIEQIKFNQKMYSGPYLDSGQLYYKMPNLCSDI